MNLKEKAVYMWSMNSERKYKVYKEISVVLAVKELKEKIWQLPDDDRITKENVGVQWVLNLIDDVFGREKE